MKDWNLIKKLIDEADDAKRIKNWKRAHVINHNKDVIYIQFCGWCITLNPDGSYFMEDTTGG